MRYFLKLAIIPVILVISACSLSKEDTALKEKIEKNSPNAPAWIKKEDIMLEQPRGKDTAFLIHVQASRDYFLPRHKTTFFMSGPETAATWDRRELGERGPVNILSPGICFS